VLDRPYADRVARPDRLERLTDLVLVLLNAARPLTLDVIAREVPGYPDDHGPRRQAFERDKRLLRAEGIPVVTEPVEGIEQFGYRIDPEAFYLPDLHLEPDERSALHLAVAGVHLGDPSGRHALLKLGATGLAEARPVTSFVPPPALVPLFEAVRARAPVTFTYRAEVRTVSPVGLWFRDGHWYVVGWDQARDAARTFRVDRIDGLPEVGEAGGARLPEGFDAAAAAPEEPWRPGEGEPTDVLLLVDAIEAARVVEEVGEEAIEERRADGSVVLRLGVTSVEALRSWVLGLLDHAEVLGPPDLRAVMVQWLSTLARPAEPGPAPDARAHAPEVGSHPDLVSPEAHPAVSAASGGSDPSGPAARDTSLRLRRLLAIVGWLARVGEASIPEISQRFGIPQAELVRELELAACCGVPPYSPDALMEIVVTEESVRAFLPKELARPRRLTAAEGFALAAASRTILAVPGADEDGALARALAKLESTLGEHPGLVVDLDDPSLLDEVRRVTDERARVEIEYHSASADETTRRVIDPVQVIALDGHWYLDAECQRAGDLRRFRVDRIRSLKVIGRQPDGERFVPEMTADSFVPGPGAVSVRLAVDEGAAWVADSVPVRAVRPLAGGGQEVTLAVGGTAWLERLLLQLGSHARVLDPPELVETAALAARRVLGRYTG
jgi:predicted DNA-binding transcriptional regulator YafY